MNRKKQRGQKRKLNNLLKNVDKFIPFHHKKGEFEHFHVPSTQWIESPKTSGKIKTIFMKKWLEKTIEFIENKPEELPFCKVVAVIDSKYLYSSQIIIFYSESYYKKFWERKDKYQKWNLINNKSLINYRKIDVNLQEKGYEEIITDEDIVTKTELWFYGEL